MDLSTGVIDEITLLPLFDDDGSWDLGLFRLTVRLTDGSADSFSVSHGEDISERIQFSRPLRLAKDRLSPILSSGVLDLSPDRVAELRVNVFRAAIQDVVYRLGRDVPIDFVLRVLQEEFLVYPVMNS